QLVDPRPFQRPTGAETFADRLQISRVRPNLRVAVHAGLGRRNPGEARLLHRAVTVAAVDAQPGHVVLMAEGDGLRLSDSSVGDVGRTLQLHQNPKYPGRGNHSQDYRGPSD